MPRPIAVAAHAPLTAAAFAATPAADLVARGAHVVATRGCTECHRDDLRGRVVESPVLGRLAGPNLTAGGRGPALADADRELALRPVGRPPHRAGPLPAAGTVATAAR
jgi:hypothetical protein